MVAATAGRLFDLNWRSESLRKLSLADALDHRYEYAVIQPTKDRSHWTIRKYGSHEELRCQQVKDWQALSGAERRKAAWELVVDYWVGTKGAHPDELRLQRSVTHLSRM